ncbi:RagB/SusD family nutrient uptake outer membrane protein [Pedobacter namyangjuensis]|uniref:RagB/SusD family nutrient uptake outer membrane protein n=1 Tax=Pedobacter namyangjuensis TaxID=600626 RepID=UPI000DE40719|nr:RagB/SusD family nutrient uptake outer membrane protein [Pedobacter namyangjuensis]
MKSYFKNVGLPMLFLTILMMFGCEKFLDEKTNATLAIPSTAKDLQALMDTYYILNETDVSADEVSAGDFYVTDTDFGTRTETDQRLYTWQNSNTLATRLNDWYYCYTIIYRTNSVIEGVDKVKPTNLTAESLKNTKGQAHFFKAKAYLQAVNIWAKGYNKQTASTDLGVPIRKEADFNAPTVRATVEDNYQTIIADLKAAIDLLPNQQIHVMRPSKAAANALLARVYLWMGNYAEALKYSNDAMAIKKDLIDFNTLTASAIQPLAQFNTEVLMASRMVNLPIIAPSRAKVLPELYNSYENNDLRKTVYFKGNADGSYAFKGSYDGTTLYFSGVATDEVYLTTAECNARLGNVDLALRDLNDLLRKRYRTGTYIDFTQRDPVLLLETIIKERRKELLFRGLRWADIKRYNRDGAGISLTRTVAGKTYTLEANSARFAIPIPEDIILLSGIPQNSY